MIRELSLLIGYLIHVCFSEEIFETVAISTSISKKRYALSDYGITTNSIRFPYPCCDILGIFLSKTLDDSLNKTIHIELCALPNPGDYVTIYGIETFYVSLRCNIPPDFPWLKWKTSGNISFGIGESQVFTRTLFDQIERPLNIEVASTKCLSWEFEISSCSPGTFGDSCDVQCGHCLGVACDRFNGECPNGCELGWSLINCTEKIDPCLDHVCFNGGTCFNDNSVASCICTSEYTGMHCEIDCTKALSEPRTDMTKGFFRKQAGLKLSTLNLLEESIQCTLMQCAFSCLLHSECWYFRFDTTMTGCQTCFLFDSSVDLCNATGTVDEHLYIFVKN